MCEAGDWVRLKAAQPHAHLLLGAIGWVIVTYEGLDAVEVIFEREEKGEIQLLIEFSEIEPIH